MTFEEILDQALAMLQRRGRVTYRTLKRQFQLDDDALEDLKAEIIKAQRLAVDEDGEVLVWKGGAASPGVPAGEPTRAPRSYTPAHLAEKILTSRSALEGERKQVTVLFADLRGSMELLADRDPEEARQLLDPVIERMMEAVHRYEGTVNQVMGDGIMALFGAPIAHEDHAMRACYAALAMQDAIRRYSEEVRRAHGIEVQIRVGLNSGEVVVRSIGSDLSLDYTAVGQTTHLAARMEQLATPGSIRLAAETLRLAEGFIQVKALGPVPVKGLAEPVEVSELAGVTSFRRRLQATAARGLTHFVGRQIEMEALGQALTRAESGHGQVVAVVGEPGVGKSRLVYEFIHSHHTRAWRVLESASVSYGHASPYFPVIDLLQRYFGIDAHDDPRTIRAKATGHVLMLDEALQETIPPLLALLNALPEDHPFSKVDPPSRRQQTLSALKRVLLRESQVQPLLLVFEDLHWIDSETQALLNSLIDSLPTAQLLLLVNYRPEYEHGWGRKTYYTQLRLDPLSPTSAEELLQALLGDDPGMPPLKRLLIERTEGNPFFLEESVRTLIETGALVGEGRIYRLSKPIHSIQVPATVQVVLAARIDRLPSEEKRLLQTAAVIGTEVPLSLLRVMAEMPEDAFHTSLSRLQAAEFLYETHLFPEHIYTFKHALTHEVTYSSLLQERRRVLHARIVDSLERDESERLTDQVDWLAHHAFRGEAWDKAVRYCRQAGLKAAARSVHREAVARYEQALAALTHLPEQQETTAQAIDLRCDLRNSLMPLGEYEQIGDYLRQAETLAEGLQDRRRLGRLAAYMAQYLWATVHHQRAVEVGQRARALATELGDLSLQVVANYIVAFAYHDLSDYRPAMDLLRQNIMRLEGDLVGERFGQPSLPSVHSRYLLAWCHGWQGEFAAAIPLIKEAARIAEAADHLGSMVVASTGGGLLYLLKGDLDEAIARLERSMALYKAMQVPTAPLVLSFLGCAYTLADRVTEALPLFEQSLERAAAQRFLPCNSLWIGWWGEASLMSGRVEEARRHAGRALEISQAQRERGYEAYALRLLGEIAAHGDSPDAEQAEERYRQALALAEELDMRPLVAHCRFGLGKLYRKSGRPEQARGELATAIDLYRAMEMTFWQTRAEGALTEVEGR
jgi:class 3 adenylate cyclase/tetratricopeptide (TPR) repeat protein